MGMDVGGPSVMGLYNGTERQGAPPDTGRRFGTQLSAQELAHRQRYAPPAVPGQQDISDLLQANGGPGIGPGQGQVPQDYNLTEGMPVKYSVPTAQKENLATRELVRKAIRDSEAGQKSGVVRTDPITDEEVQYVKYMKDQAEVADLDRYVNTFFDLRKPGNMPKLMEIYPQFIERRIQQIKTDYEYAIRSQMIDQWGVNTFDDLLFLYWRDQGKIKGPRLTTQNSVDHRYTAGYLSPFYWGLDTRNPNGLRLPYATAKYGKRPGDTDADADKWILPDDIDQPLTAQRNVEAYAKALYDTDASAPGGAGSAQRYDPGRARLNPRP